jgi:hypothetical protein
VEVELPRLLLFAPCQKGIVDKNEGTVSMIGLVNGVTVASLSDAVEENAVLPYSWCAVSAWYKEEGDEDASFEDLVELVTPNGNIVVRSVIPFSISARIHQNLHNSFGFPVGEPGVYTLRISIRRLPEESEWSIVSEYPIEVIHHPAEGITSQAVAEAAAVPA